MFVPAAFLLLLIQMGPPTADRLSRVGPRGVKVGANDEIGRRNDFTVQNNLLKLLTEFADPAGNFIYFHVPNPQAKEFVDDELADPR